MRDNRAQWQLKVILNLSTVVFLYVNWKEIMKKLVIVSILVLFTGSAYAGSCPMMAKNLDTKIEEAQKMRDAGMKAHDAGEHAKSEELLNKALEMFKS